MGWQEEGNGFENGEKRSAPKRLSPDIIPMRFLLRMDIRIKK